MKCMYSYENGDYCLKHSHGAADVHCTGEDGCPDFKPNKTFTIGKPIRVTADMIGEADFSLTKDLIQRIAEAQDIVLKEEIKANTVVINGHRYGMLKNRPGLIPTVFGMRLETRVDMPDNYDFIVQYREPEPMTNYDRLISKTPEELAEYLSSICYDFWKMFVDDPKKMWLDWLKSPVDDGGTE